MKSRLLYSYAHFIVEMKENLALIEGFNTIYWWCVIVAYFFRPPCSYIGLTVVPDLCQFYFTFFHSTIPPFGIGLYSWAHSPSAGGRGTCPHFCSREMPTVVGTCPHFCSREMPTCSVPLLFRGRHFIFCNASQWWIQREGAVGTAVPLCLRIFFQ